MHALKRHAGGTRTWFLTFLSSELLIKIMMGTYVEQRGREKGKYDPQADAGWAGNI